METITGERWWTGADTGAFAAWVADRAAAEPTHCVRLDTVGRGPAGQLTVRTESLQGTPLPAALDRIGTPTVGVAVTLTVPLLELAADARAGAVLLGTARADDVLVDDAGVTVLVDRPPDADAVPDVTAHPSDHGRRRPPSQHGRRATPRGPGPCEQRAAPSRAGESSGTTALLLAVRSVWERVDPRAPCRPAVDAAIAGALDGDVDQVRQVLRVVLETGPPRPVRWTPPRADFAFAVPPTPQPDGVGALVRQVVEQGLTLPAGIWVPARGLLIGGVLAVGLAAAGLLNL